METVMLVWKEEASSLKGKGMGVKELLVWKEEASSLKGKGMCERFFLWCPWCPYSSLFAGLQGLWRCRAVGVMPLPVEHGYK